MVMTGNTPYVAARAKSRRQKLADRARLRQLISQSPDQLTVAIGDIGYRTEMDMYAGRLSGCLLYTSPSPRDRTRSRMPSSA